MAQVSEKLSILLADTYALYLKTQNYHWHVRGVHFKVLHELFEEQYRELAEAIDELAERIRTLGDAAPASFKQYQELKTISDGNSHADAQEMVNELYEDHGKLIEDLNACLQIAQQKGDEGSLALLSDRISSHEKTRWMLGASR